MDEDESSEFLKALSASAVSGDRSWEDCCLDMASSETGHSQEWRRLRVGSLACAGVAI